MTVKWSATRKAIAALLLASTGVGLLAAPVAAQQDDARLRRIEAEMRALQRAVFPNGDNGRFFTPEVVTPAPGSQPAVQPGASPSGSALTDVLARLDTLERQIARMTAASEENQNSLAQLQRKFDEAQAVLATERAAQAAAAVPTQPSGSLSLPQLGSSSPAVRSTPTPTPSSATPRATPTPAASRPAATTPTPSAAPSAARLAAVRAIAKPSTDNPGDDEYSYGFRLYEAGYFAEARQQLALFLQKYPNHERVSYGRNLLGRAYLDDGQPREAAKYFFDNYQANKQGARAADSLLFLSETMIAIGDNSRACIALAEFGDTYPALATGRLKEQYDRTKSKVRCT